MTDLCIATDRLNDAQSLLETALKQTPNNAVLMVNYANVLLKQQKFSESIRVLQRYTTIIQTIPTAGICYQKPTVAMAIRRKIWRLKPKSQHYEPTGTKPFSCIQ